MTVGPDPFGGPPPSGLPAIVPAAGLSRRMGRPKLILPLGDRTILERVLLALREGGAGPVVVVTGPPDQEGAPAVADAARRAGAAVATPSAPVPDMADSIRLGLRHWLRVFGEANLALPSHVLLTPGDAVGVDRRAVAGVVQVAREAPGAIVVPAEVDPETSPPRRGHPAAIPRELFDAILELPPGLGVNVLLRNADRETRIVPVPRSAAPRDLDTPDDYARARKHFGECE